MASMKRCSFIMVVSALLLTGIAVVVWHYVMPPLHFVESEEYPDVFPDYVKVTIPESMSSDNGALFTMAMKDGRRNPIVLIELYVAKVDKNFYLPKL